MEEHENAEAEELSTEQVLHEIKVASTVGRTVTSLGGLESNLHLLILCFLSAGVVKLAM